MLPISFISTLNVTCQIDCSPLQCKSISKHYQAFTEVGELAWDSQYAEVLADSVWDRALLKTPSQTLSPRGALAKMKGGHDSRVLWLQRVVKCCLILKLVGRSRYSGSIGEEHEKNKCPRRYLDHDSRPAGFDECQPDIQPRRYGPVRH